MYLNPTDQAFVDRRRRLIALWPYVGGGMLAGLLGFATWLWLFIPLMVNPWATVEALKSGSLEETTLYVMAVLLPILMLACLGAFVLMVGLAFAVFRNERRLIEILDRQRRD